MTNILSQDSCVVLADHELLINEKEDTRRWLRAEMDRLVDPMLDSMFHRLTNKLTWAEGQPGDGDDHGKLMNLNSYVEPSLGQLYEPVDFNVQLLPSTPTPSHLTIPVDPRSTGQSSPTSPVPPPPVSIINAQITLHGMPMASVQSQHAPPSLSSSIVNEQSNFYDEDDAGECYCDECLGAIEIDDEVEDDDDSDSVQCIEDGQELPEKRARFDSTQPNNAQPEVARLSQGQLTEAARPNKVINQHNQILTVHLQCPELGCPKMLAVNELNDHLMDEHSIGPNRCVVKDCKQSFNNRHILSEHIKRVHRGTSQWHCDKCSKHYSTYHRLSHHNFQLHQLGHFQCSFPSCPFTGEYKMKVYNHYTQQHKQTLNCQHPGCNFQTPNSSEMKTHERTHSGIKPYRCKWFQCDFASARQSDTIRHIRLVHLAPKPGSVPNGAQLDPKDYVEVIHELL